MYLFVIGNFRPRRKRHRRADDALPTAPLLDALLFWTLFGIGALSGSVALAGAVIAEREDAFIRTAAVIAAIACAACVAVA